MLYIIYNICMYGWYVCPLNERAGNFFCPKNTAFLGLTPIYSETTTLSKPYFILKLRSVRKFLRKCLLFKKQKVDSTSYYGIEDPFQIWFQNFAVFGGYEVQIVGCQEPPYIESDVLPMSFLCNYLIIYSSIYQL